MSDGDDDGVHQMLTLIMERLAKIEKENILNRSGTQGGCGGESGDTVSPIGALQMRVGAKTYQRVASRLCAPYLSG